MTIKMANFIISRFGASFILTILIIFATFHLNHSDPSRRFMRGWKHESLLGAPTGQYNGDLPRYFVNDTFYKPGGPVFLMIGGEGTASPLWMVMGHWIDLAKKVNALCFQVEHRYYGKSHPTPDMSTENLEHLSSEQALADLASFRTAMANKMGLQTAKWIAFGGSYPDYFGVVRDSLATTGPNCDPAIQAATDAVIALIKTAEGRKQLKTQFKLCDDLGTDIQDQENFLNTLAGNFAGVVQYNKDNRAFEGAVGTNITIDILCGIMTNTKIGNPLQRYAAVNTLMMKTYNQSCLDFKYSNMIKEMQQTAWTSSAGVGGRQWTYQTCTEFGYYQTSDLPNQPFKGFPLKFSTQQCTDIYGKNFTSESNKRGITWTNTNYGALGIKVTRVVFPNGSIDPWHALGVTKDLSPEATAIYIKGTAHCANMYPATPSDPPQLIAARAAIDKLVMGWIQQD